MADAPNGKPKTELLDELEKGPWPSFVKEIMSAAEGSDKAAGLLQQLELSYKEKKGHWKHGGMVGVLGYGGGVIGFHRRHHPAGHDHRPSFSHRWSREELRAVPVFEIDGKTYEVDEDGFLQEPERWNDDVAKDFAQTEAITDLTEGHWKVIHYIRNYYLQFGIAPMVRKLCKETGAQRDLPIVPVRPGERRVQAGGTAQTNGLRVSKYDKHGDDS
jgi:dissimilatory sulfite reductase related protein